MKAQIQNFIKVGAAESVVIVLALIIVGTVLTAITIYPGVRFVKSPTPAATHWTRN